MSVTQTVDIPVNHRLMVDVPREVPAGRTILIFKPITEVETASIKTLRGTLRNTDTSDIRDESNRTLSFSLRRRTPH